jgi:PEP-CTERM motif
MQLRYALTSACGGVVLLVSAQASATTYTGPVFPAPGGTSFSTNGITAVNSGRVATYQGFDLNATDQLYFGITNVGLAMDGAIDSPGETLTFDSALSNLAGGIVVYDGSSLVLNAALGIYQTAYNHFTLTFTDLSNNALSLTINPDIGGGLFPVLDVQGGFHVGEAFTSSSSISGPYTATSTYFNNLNTVNTPNLLQSSFSGGFYYTESALPEPSTWALMLIGFGSIGMSLRRSRRKTRPLLQLA